METTTQTTTELSKNDRFDGEFDFLPFAASIEFGAVPEFPTEDQFHIAAGRANDSPAARWFCEAVRYRRHHPGAKLDAVALKAIALSTSQSLYRLSMRER
jgi:hypothetical protein